MMERHDHINPWADKLQDIRLPGENESWKAMEAVLDEEMPMGKWGNRRRWLLLIILLLLLIGVCNCPGRRSAHWLGSGKDTARHSTFDGRDTALFSKNGRPVVRMQDSLSERRPEDVAVRNPDDATKRNPDGLEKPVSGGPEERSSGNGRGGAPVHGTNGGDHAGVTKTAVLEKKEVRAKRYKDGRGKRKKKAPEEMGDTVRDKAESIFRGNGVVGDTTFKGSNPAGDGKVGANKVVGDSVVRRKRKSADSVAAANRKTPPPDSVVDRKGWVFGGGFNQFFTLGQQQQSRYNSNGTTGGLSDYIPVPMVRYYFSRKLFVQLEAQFNTPQYTSKNLLAGQSKVDSTSAPGQLLQSDLYIKKLFYFNLPLSVHYSPIPNLYAGGGIQYSRLTNGVALIQDKALSSFGTAYDTLRASKIQSFKQDSTYQKLRTNEFRLMLDLSYNYKRFIVGARYNRALSKFLDVKISNNQVSQSRNSSFQVFLRYIIWDGRKKRLLPK